MKSSEFEVYSPTGRRVCCVVCSPPFGHFQTPVRVAQLRGDGSRSWEDGRAGSADSVRLVLCRVSFCQTPEERFIGLNRCSLRCCEFSENLKTLVSVLVIISEKN